MATMVCHRSLDSQFTETAWPHLNFKSPFEFLTFNSCFLNLDLDPSNSLNQCHNLNQIATGTNSVLPLPPSAAGTEAKSPMATEELESAVSYVHSRSRSTLSDKSLAICTEDLGSETGSSDFVVDDDDSVFSDLRIARSPTRNRVKSGDRGCGKSFPPPLTTISGADSIRVRSYREDGRLIMEAVKAPARLAYFHADRSHGRLRLSILRSTNPEVEVEEESTGNELKIRNDDVEAVGEEGNCEENKGGKVGENGSFGGAEIEMEKILRPCRCKEAGRNSNNIDENRNNNSGILLLTRPPLSIWVSTS